MNENEILEDIKLDDETENTGRELKTKPYVRRAQDNYRKKFDQTLVRLPKGCIEAIKANVTDKSVNSYIADLVVADLKKKYKVDLGK